MEKTAGVREFRAGNLSLHLNEWRKITNDSWVLNTVKGLKIPLTEVPFQSKEPKPFNLSKTQQMNLDTVLSNLLNQGVIQDSHEQSGQIISNVFLRPKPNNKFRLILDLSEFNTLYVEYQHFKMTNLKMALDLVSPGIFMSSIDLSDAYFTVSIHEDSRKFLKFRWKGKLFQFAALPNGLACAPRLFTKLLNPVFAFFRSKGWSCFQYIDDSIILDESKERCESVTLQIAKQLEELGFFIHVKKSKMIPSTLITFLGFDIDSVAMLVAPTQEKKDKIRRIASEMLQKTSCTIREVAGFVGLAGSFSVASEFGANHSKQLELDKNRALARARGNYDENMFISLLGKEDILWWFHHAQHLARKFTQTVWDYTISTDASLKGWGAVSELGNTNGRWSQTETTLHINVLESKAILFALHSLVKTKGLAIKILSDNSTAVSYLNKKGGVHSPKCLQISQQIWDYAELMNLKLCAAHIPGKHNFLADMYSRNFKDNTEWELNPDIFEIICGKWGTPDIDLFASRLNKKCEVFVSWKPDPLASYIDAFALNWSFKFAYAFPPFSLVSRVWQKLKSEGTKSILVAPYWPSQHWFAAVNNSAKETLLFQRRRKNLVHPCHSLQEEPITTIPIIAFLF